jgi:flagellar L-ring protein precursor FlgH
MSRTLYVFFSLALFLALDSTAAAQSLWQRRDPYRVFLFADTQARTVGDLLTVLISENTDVDNKDNRAMNKDTTAGGLFNFNTDANGESSSVQIDGKTTSNRKFDGRSEYSVAREFSDRITVTVVGIKPNGNLLIAGKRKHLVAGEVRTLALSGIVRPLDIRGDNSIESRYVANLQMDYLGRGPDSSFSNQGWLGRVVNVVWPF